jgi:hypothetical protein
MSAPATYRSRFKRDRTDAGGFGIMDDTMLAGTVEVVLGFFTPLIVSVLSELEGKLWIQVGLGGVEVEIALTHWPTWSKLSIPTLMQVDLSLLLQ